MSFTGHLSLLLRYSFAIPSLISRDDNTGFRETDMNQTHLIAACRAEYRGRPKADFMRRRCKADASMERGWYGLGARKVDDTFLSAYL